MVVKGGCQEAYSPSLDLPEGFESSGCRKSDVGGETQEIELTNKEEKSKKNHEKARFKRSERVGRRNRHEMKHNITYSSTRS